MCLTLKQGQQLAPLILDLGYEEAAPRIVPFSLSFRIPKSNIAVEMQLVI